MVIAEIGPPMNMSCWPDLALSLDIVVSPIELRRGLKEHFEVLKKFRDCLETLARPGDKYPIGYVMQKASNGGIHNNISYMNIKLKIEDFAEDNKSDYNTVLRELRESSELILKGGKNPYIKTFEKFTEYLVTNAYSSRFE
jgi:hypothetical protein